MAMQTLTGSQYNLRDIIDSAIQQTDMNLSNPLIDKSRINVINYYSAMAQYMIAAETNNDKLVNAAHKNVRDALNGNDLYLENDIYFREAKKRVEEFIGQNIGTQDGTGYYEVITNSNACEKCKELSHRGKLSDIDNALLPPYHPNCKCRVEMFDSVGNAINISEKINNIVDSSSNAKAIPWYLWLLNELGDKEEDFIKKFSKGNIGGGVLNLLGATLGTPKSLYLNALNAVTSMMKGEPLTYQYNMDYRDYQREQTRKFGGKSIADFTDDLRAKGLAGDIASTMIDLSFEIMTESLYLVFANKAIQRHFANRVKMPSVRHSDDVVSVGKANYNDVKVNIGKQDKHIPGTNNYKQEISKGNCRSILREELQQLLDNFAGTGQKIGENRERIDFGRVIGQYYDITTGTFIDTTRGIIHYDSKGGAHIVPSAPK